MHAFLAVPKLLVSRSLMACPSVGRYRKRQEDDINAQFVNTIATGETTGFRVKLLILTTLLNYMRRQNNAVELKNLLPLLEETTCCLNLT